MKYFSEEQKQEIREYDCLTYPAFFQKNDYKVYLQWLALAGDMDNVYNGQVSVLNIHDAFFVSSDPDELEEIADDRQRLSYEAEKAFADNMKLEYKMLMPNALLNAYVFTGRDDLHTLSDSPHKTP